MEKYQKASKEFNEKLVELKKETRPSIYGGELSEIILYDKLLELEEQLLILRTKLSTWVT